MSALALAGCVAPDEDSAPATVTETVTVEAEPAAREYDRGKCDLIASQKAINTRLHRDGYADDYGAEWDRLADVEGCP